jgi:hypothetical protein
MPHQSRAVVVVKELLKQRTDAVECDSAFACARTPFDKSRTASLWRPMGIFLLLWRQFKQESEQLAFFIAQQVIDLTQNQIGLLHDLH